MIKFNDFASEVEKYSPQFKRAIDNVLKSGWFILGKEVESFEFKFADFVGTKYCIGVANGLEAIQISLMALGIKKDDEVITTPFSAVATTLAIINIGAKPVFVDTDNKGLLNPLLIQEKINKRTKAILPVHLYGQPVDLKAIKKLCQANNLYLIEDACQAHGSFYMNKKLGTFGIINCFSFYPTKNLGCFGDGGAITTNNSNLAKICRQVRDYGQIKKYIHKRCGLNSRLDEIQASILKVKLEKLEKENNFRKKLAKRYIKNLGKNTLLEIVTDNIEESNFHLFVVKTPKRDSLQKYLLEKGIQTLIHYPKIITDQPFIKSEFSGQKFPVSKTLSQQVLSLPCNPQITLLEIDYISREIINFTSG